MSTAIRTAEARTDGEIFCVIAQRCSDYRLVPLLWAALLALLVPLPMIVAAHARAELVYLAQLLAFVVAVLVLSHPALRVRLVPARVLRERAHAEAVKQFFAQGIDRRPHRTGVLIFASVAERYVELLADAAINDTVAPGAWDGALAPLLAGLRDGRAADGFVATIEACGAMLATHFPPGTLPRGVLADRLVEI